MVHVSTESARVSSVPFYPRHSLGARPRLIVERVTRTQTSEPQSIAPVMSFEGDSNLGSGCPHIAAVLVNDTEGAALLDRFSTVIKWNMHRNQSVAYPAKRRKVSRWLGLTIYALNSINLQISPPQCGVCNIALSRPYACLHCTFSACWRDDHIKQHLQDTGHDFC